MKKQLQAIEEVKWDKKSTKTLILLILILFTAVFGLVKGPEIYRNFNSNKFKETTTGKVYSIKDNEILEQGFFGQKITRPFSTLEFYYKVDGKTYHNINNLPRRGKFLKYIDKIENSNLDKIVLIKFNKSNPTESYLIID